MTEKNKKQEEEVKPLRKPRQNRLKGILKRGEEYWVRHRKGTQKVKIMKGIDLQEDTEVKVKDLETGETQMLQIVLCHFTKVEEEE